MTQQEREAIFQKLVDRAYRQTEARLQDEDKQRRKDEEDAKTAKKFDAWSMTWDPLSDDPIPPDMQAELDKNWERMVAATSTPEAQRESPQTDRRQAEIAEWDAEHSRTTIWDWITYLRLSTFGVFCRYVWAAFLLALIATPVVYLLTGNPMWYQLTGYLIIPTFILVAVGAPWYWLLTFLPMLVILGSLHPTSYDITKRDILLLWAWSLFGLLHGLHRALTGQHLRIKHPWLFFGAGIGTHYILKNKLGKKE